MDREDDVDPRYELRLGAGRPLPEAIADKIRELVDNGMFKPGSKLPSESELARNMRVARSSVRTALQRLETFGICEGKRGVGWYVRRTPVQSAGGADGLFLGKRYAVSDLFEVRIGLEGLAVSLAAVRATLRSGPGRCCCLPRRLMSCAGACPPGSPIVWSTWRDLHSSARCRRGWCSTRSLPGSSATRWGTRR